MHDLRLSLDLLARLRAEEPRYDGRAYLFMLAAIEYLQSRLDARRHVSGAELAWACRDFAVQQFGLLAPQVLGFWGIERTDDYGRIVFVLVKSGLLSALPSDREEDFAGVYEFTDAFGGPYAWEGVIGLSAKTPLED
ncbi:MAG: hypothetical protein OEW17_11450 [Gemmatimonadota bacterium]|nr:hypothetical protein [Gemmatimonadota bacterium]MDH4349413.1 hypothetical protein [Gemmatimonadota bacterium]MDH5284808.1 hypothetical protein [Gemmatimonadota bacterium]